MRGAPAQQGTRPGADRAGPGEAAGLLARLDRIPVWGLPWSHLAIIGLGYFFTFYDITDIGFGMPAISRQFRLTSSEAQFVALSVGLVGYIVGSLLIGALADRYGRYRIFLLTIALTAVGSFGDAAAGGVVSLSVWRFVTGMGVGADLNLVSTYVGELAPPGQRGRVSVLTFLVGILGQAVTPFVALGLVPTYRIGWRLLFVIGGVIAAVGLLLRTELPESPRWLVAHGRVGEAEAIVARMEATARERGASLPPPRPAAALSPGGKFPVRHLFRRPYLDRLAVFVPLWLLWYIGNYGFLGDAPTLFSSHGITIGGSILYLSVGAIGYPVGALIMVRISDRVERKLLILAATVVWLAGMVLIGSRADEAAIIVGSFLGATGLGLYLQVAYTYTAESFPTRARASGFAIADGVGHGGGAIGALLLPVLVTHTSFFVGFATIGVTGLLAGLLALAGPASTGQSLDAVSA